MADRIEIIAGHLTAGGVHAKKPIGVIQVGLGPIGQRMVADVLGRKGLVLTGAVDIDPRKIGKDVSEVCANLRGPVGVTVRPPTDLASIPGEVCIVTTVSKLERLVPMLEMCISARKHVVSSCEELAYPFASHPALAAKIDRMARENGVSVLGTGINPGYLMDTLPVMLSGLCRNVKAVRVERHQDSRIRRLPFQQKIGAGLNIEEWTRLRDSGKIKHVGFPQSLHLIAAALGWKLDSTEETVEPVIATTDVSSPLLKVPAGKCAGVRQTAIGYRNGKALITLELIAYNGLEKPHDTVILTGEPDVRSSIAGGAHGDISTSAIIINCISSLVSSKPGLRTMTDIPICHWIR